VEKKKKGKGGEVPRVEQKDRKTGRNTEGGKTSRKRRKKGKKKETEKTFFSPGKEKPAL